MTRILHLFYFTVGLLFAFPFGMSANAQQAVWDPEEIARLAEKSAHMAEALSRAVELHNNINDMSRTVGRLGALPDARLRSVARSPLAPILAFCTVAVGLGMWMIVYLPAPDGPSVPNVPVAPPPPPPPWQGQPTVKSLILACERAIEETRLLPGFEIEAASCGLSGTSVNYRRHWGSIAWLPKNNLVTSPDRVTLVAPLSETLVRRSGEEQPPTLDALRRLIWGAAQTYLLDSELNEQVQPGSTLLPSRAANNAEVSPFRTVNLALGSRLPPSVLSGLLAKIPTFVAEEVSWQSASWHVKGKAYVR